MYTKYNVSTSMYVCSLTTCLGLMIAFCAFSFPGRADYCCDSISDTVDTICGVDGAEPPCKIGNGESRGLLAATNTLLLRCAMRVKMFDLHRAKILRTTREKKKGKPQKGLFSF